MHIFALNGEPTPARPKKGTGRSLQSALPHMTKRLYACPGESTDGKGESKSDSGEEKAAAPPAPAQRKNPTSAFSWASGFISAKYLESEWSFAKFKVPDNSQTIVAFGEEKNSIIGTIDDRGLQSMRCLFLRSPVG